MRDAPAALVAFLATRRNSIQADLFLIQLSNGTTYAWTSYDQPLRVAPYLYLANGPTIDRSKWEVKNTIEVPELEIRIFSNGTDMPDGSNIKLAAHNGIFDFATVTLSRIFMPSPGDTSLGPVAIFTGQVAQIEIDALSINMTVKGANNALAQYMPRNQYMSSCTHSVYDPQCAPNPGQPGGGPSRAANTVPNFAGAGSTRFQVVWGEAPPANYVNFGLGYVTFTSGVLIGVTRTIPSGQANADGFGLSYPFYADPAEGDTFTVTYGCNRSRGALGCAFFDNLQHYRGEPWIPPAAYGV